MENTDQITPAHWPETTGSPASQRDEMNFLTMNKSVDTSSDLQFLHSEESDSEETFVQTVPDEPDNMPSEAVLLASISSTQYTTLSPQSLRSLFEPEGLAELLAMGVDVQQLEAEGKLKQLSFLVPVKVSLQPTRLVGQLVTLLVPQISEKGEIGVQLQPYLSRIPSEIIFSEGQRDAIEAAEPFYCIKRVLLDQGSDELMDKQDALWRAVSHLPSLSRPLFDEMMLTLIHHPENLPEIALRHRWYEYQRKDYWEALNAHFPWQIGIFNGLTIHFYPLASLQALPHLDGLVKRLIPREEEN